jgi:FkbM family methyltransferase
MRILIYSHAFAPNVGGVETVVMHLAAGLSRVVNANGGPSAEVTVVTPVLRGTFDDGTLPFRLVRCPSLLELARQIRHADVMHVAGASFLPMLLGLLLGKPVVVEHHGFQTICPNGQLLHEPTQKPCPGHFIAGRHRECIRCNAQIGLLASLKLWLLTFPRRWLCARAAANVTPTRWLSSLLGLPRMTTIYHGLPGECNHDFSPVSSLPPVVAFIGRLVSTKGVDVLLRAASRVKAKGLAFTLRIIGDGPQRSCLEEQAEAMNLGDRVKFLGYQPDAKLPEALSGVSTVVVPSLAGEVFGLVAAENMRRGILPIVSGDALAEVVGDTGLSFPPGDDEALAGCLEWVLRSPEYSATGRRRARQRAMGCFSGSLMAAQHLAVYDGLMGGPTSPPGGSTVRKLLSEVTRQVATLRAYARSIGLMHAFHLRCYDLVRRWGSVTLPSSVRFTLRNASYPVTMRTGGSSDRQVLHQVFIQEEYEPLALEYPNVILDLGANVGYSSAYFLSKYPTARVVAVEPDPDNCALCRRNLSPFGKRATVVHGAAWPERVRLVLVRGAFRDGREWATQVKPAAHAEGEVANVEGYDVPALIGLTGGTQIDLLKIDIEGSERELFERNTDTWLPSIRNLCVELHDHDSAAAFFGALSRYSFDCFRSGELTVCRNLRICLSS